jgi:hypothetical protein
MSPPFDDTPFDGTPLVPTVRITPCDDGSGHWFLLLHLRLSPEAIAKMVTALEDTTAAQILREAKKRDGHEQEP